MNFSIALGDKVYLNSKCIIYTERSHYYNVLQKCFPPKRFPPLDCLCTSVKRLTHVPISEEIQCLQPRV